ncbi:MULTISPECIES: septation ring formation regulator EzrA [unclassified Enterococcus]|uniref:septation ring formation regulator EzrA n=1 Tax=unclassified Enterococcus TaxID=2608891 RepID=UPI001556BC34|nr:MULTISPECIES: septation ring formation regulator EzrA [unclassified Enterococcus]MBS7578112.1 septation ring formation regulator EzrA [Enterococcus sp. MMGLQ5-2]MBS7585372.1 septation ring formation regulator EzrA [Enterococcus sp. MMGLQ5-1]NPD13229.1 septation ring formation regulator EzrA [Enterococcus sp. MMGLQ5-1]NPD37943.1 septation ring formation regulator EzrA [Enterococcus sp. MMGLQ5-2]
MPRSLIWVIVILLIIIVAFYIVSLIFKKKSQDRLDALEERKNTLFELPVSDEIERVKQMHLVGESQNTFREWNQKWTDILNNSLADLESHIFEAENLNETLRFIKAGHIIDTAESQIELMETDVQSIRNGLKNLRETEEKNSIAVQEALDVYEELSKTIKESKSKFGNTVSELEKRLYNIEIEFTQFVALNTSGDPIEATKVLKKAEEDTYDLKSAADRIPPIIEELNETFPAQIDELEKGYQKLIDQKYVFSEKNIEAQISEIKGKITSAISDIERFEIDETENNNENIQNAIDSLYDIFENEIDAKVFVTKNIKTIKDYINHAKENNKKLLIEIDHVSQSYALNHNELGRARSYQNEIEEIERQTNELIPKIENNEKVYTEAKNFLDESFRVLADIEKEQVTISNTLDTLRQDEKIALQKIDDFELELRAIKRHVEKQRLPGLPQEYTDFFFTTTEQVEGLIDDLNKVRINIEEINQKIKACGEEINLLGNRTEELIDAAGLAEQLMQYANRWRHNTPIITQAFNRSYQLFAQEYAYKASLDEIGSALEKIEPGSFKRIEQYYFKNKDSLFEN